MPGDLQVLRGMFLWIVASLWRGREPWGYVAAKQRLHMGRRDSVES